MSSVYSLDLRPSGISKLYYQTTINDNTKSMAKKVIGNKKKIRLLLIEALGQANLKGKPCPLKRFEVGYRKYLFGENGLLTQMIPGLRQYYIAKRLKHSFRSAKIDAGDLTYLYATLKPNVTKNKELDSKVGRIRRSAFFAIDNTKHIDFHHSHMPSINRLYCSRPKTEQKKRKTKCKTILSPSYNSNLSEKTNTIPNLSEKTNTIPNLSEKTNTTSNLNTQIFQSERPSTKSSQLFVLNSAINQSKYIKKKNGRCKSMVTKQLMTQLDVLNEEQSTAERNLIKIIDSSKSLYSSHRKDKMEEDKLKDMEALYDIEHNPDNDDYDYDDEINKGKAPKTNVLINEVKRTQKEQTNSQLRIMKLSYLIGNMNEGSLANYGNIVSQQYEYRNGFSDRKNLNSLSHPLLKKYPNLLIESKEKMKNKKKLLFNSERMKKITYNAMKRKSDAINMLDYYNH